MKKNHGNKNKKQREVFTPIIRHALDLGFDAPDRGVHVYMQQDFCINGECVSQPWWQGYFVTETNALLWIHKQQADCWEQKTFILYPDEEENNWPLTKNVLPPLGITAGLCTRGVPNTPMLVEPKYGRFLMMYIPDYGVNNIIK